MVPIPTEKLKRVTDVLKDLMEVRTEYGGNFNNSYGEIERYGILRIKEKVELILSLASKDGFVAKEIQLDHINNIKEAMAGIRPHKRSVTKTIAAAVGVAAFGTFLHNWSTLSKVKEDLDHGMQKQEFMIEAVDEKFLRMEETSSRVDEQYGEIVTHVKELEHLNRQQLANRLDHFLHLMLQSFRIGLQDFASGITELMRHRLSPC